MNVRLLLFQFIFEIFQTLLQNVTKATFFQKFELKAIDSGECLLHN